MHYYTAAGPTQILALLMLSLCCKAAQLLKRLAYLSTIHRPLLVDMPTPLMGLRQ